MRPTKEENQARFTAIRGNYSRKMNFRRFSFFLGIGLCRVGSRKRVEDQFSVISICRIEMYLSIFRVLEDRVGDYCRGPEGLIDNVPVTLHG